jgi:hypothetical protein|tara:strand:- start:320 stop:664 length:345 start_codon:yes stop_codon:yes gene_type:complete
MAIGMLFSAFELIRRQKLRVEYALLWILIGFILFMFGVFPSILYLISKIIGLHYFTMMLLVIFLFFLLMILHFTIIISRQKEYETELAQKLALLTLRVVKLEKNIAFQRTRSQD